MFMKTRVLPQIRSQPHNIVPSQKGRGIVKHNKIVQEKSGKIEQLSEG